jgi:hypothetical protein
MSQPQPQIIVLPIQGQGSQPMQGGGPVNASESDQLQEQVTQR